MLPECHKPLLAQLHLIVRLSLSSIEQDQGLCHLHENQGNCLKLSVEKSLCRAVFALSENRTESQEIHDLL